MTRPWLPGPGYWEINIGLLMNKTARERRAETPRVDVNYGVGRRIQLKFEMPWVVSMDREAQQTETGAGNGTVGVKWRFVGHQWIFGLSTEGHVLPRLELLAELHDERTIDEASEVIVVGGGRLKLTSTVILLLAAGHTVHSLPDEGPRTYFYTGLQLNLPGQFMFTPERPRPARRRRP